MSYQQLKDALLKFYSDKSRSREQTADDLRALKDEIDMLLDSLR